MTTPSPTGPRLASHKLFSPGNTFTGEKVRGLLASLASGATASGLNFAGMAMGLSPGASSLLAVYILGNFLTYCFDILFAKREFYIPSGYGAKRSEYEGPVAYGAIGVRMAWLLQSMAGPQFFRYVISVIIDTLTGLAILKATIDTLDRNEILMDYRVYRDFGVSSIITLMTFFLFVNVLRFDWAYSDKPGTSDPTMNIVVLAWLATSMMSFSIMMRPGDAAAASPAASPATPRAASTDAKKDYSDRD